MNKIEVQKLYSMLGICRKAGRVILGFDAVRDAILKDELAIVLLTRDISRRSGEKITAAAHDKSLRVRTIPLSMDEIAALTGKASGIIGVSDKGLADALEKLVRANEEDTAC